MLTSNIKETPMILSKDRMPEALQIEQKLENLSKTVQILCRVRLLFCGRISNNRRIFVSIYNVKIWDHNKA